MVLIPLHKAITKEVPKAAGFSGWAADRAAAANARADDKQGDDASGANLHAMPSIPTQGPAARSAVRTASQGFVRNVSTRVASKPRGSEAWTRFLQVGR